MRLNFFILTALSVILSAPKSWACEDHASEKTRPQLRKVASEKLQTSAPLEVKYPTPQDPEYYFSCYDKSPQAKIRCE